jgi:hypothetical protein
MASPAPIPPYRTPRSFAGPVVLIILGIIFLLGTLGKLRWAPLAHAFAHYWPLLLILWGIIKLFEYRQAQERGTRASGVGVGGVVLVIFLIAIGLAATQASRLDWDELAIISSWATGTSSYLDTPIAMRINPIRVFPPDTACMSPVTAGR